MLGDRPYLLLCLYTMLGAFGPDSSHFFEVLLS